MEPTIKEKKKKLEQMLGFDICPHTVEKVNSSFGVFALTGDDLTYHCSVNGSTAKGGEIRTSIPGGARTPCNIEFAEQCSVYRQTYLQIEKPD